ncbi:MAG: hypothetical protein EOP33_01900 [Rickettsiaceae bacterium]|nr:MAG: hypothetical protein EOP33_01900 [Rickettsiaceae bacterium]
MYVMKILSSIIVFAAFIANSQGDYMVALVNNEPITSYELESRKRMLLKINNIQNPDRKTIDELNKFAINSLIDESILSQYALKIGGKVSQAELENAIVTIEKRNKMPTGYLLQSLGDDAIRNSFKLQIRNELIKMNIMSQISRSVTVSSSEVDEIIIDANAKNVSVLAEVYTSKGKDEIVFKKMQSLTKKLKTCNTLGSKVYESFVNKSKIEGSLSDQDSQTQNIVKNLGIGVASTIFETEKGFVTILLCNKKLNQTSTEENNYVNNLLINKKVSQKAQKFFNNLRKKSYIKIMTN